MVYSLYTLSTGIIHGSIDLQNTDNIQPYLLDDDGNLVNGYVEGFYQAGSFKVVDNNVTPYEAPIDCVVWVENKEMCYLKIQIGHKIMTVLYLILKNKNGQLTDNL